MTRIEIYGAGGPVSDQIESFCVRMGYTHILRNVAEDPQSMKELRERSSGPVLALPAVFIGSYEFDRATDLINMQPFKVQQLIGE